MVNVHFQELWAKRGWNSYSFRLFLLYVSIDRKALCSVGTAAGWRLIPGSVVSLSPITLSLSFSWWHQLPWATNLWIVCHPLPVLFHSAHTSVNRPLIKLSSIKSLEAAIYISLRPVGTIFDMYFLQSLILMPWFLTCVSLLSLTTTKIALIFLHAMR